MPTLEEGNYTAEFLASEASGTRSREIVTIASGNIITAGMVLGQITADGKYAPHESGASDGTETAVAVAYEDVDASAADQDVTAIVRDAEVFRDRLAWDASVDNTTKEDAAIAQMADVGIITR